MALVTHQVQGSYSTFPKRPVSLKRVMESKQFLATFPTVGRTGSYISLKRKICLRVGAPLILGSKGKALRISSFKGSGENDESGGRASGSKPIKNSIKLSYVSQESEETLTESPKVQNAQVSSTSEADETRAASLAIHNLFMSWLTLLRTPAPSQVADETLEAPSLKEISEIQNGTQNNERGEALKVVWCNFLGLDAKIKIPLMIFFPMYLAVNIKYGAEVAKELTPLWILGPLIIAVYIKMLQGLFSLCVFSFNQTVKVVKIMVYDYILPGKLWDFRNLNPIEVSKRKKEEFDVWWEEKKVDYLESIWPRYCRTIRFLKRAHFI